MPQTCSACGHENPSEAKFCLECGASLALTCAQCGIELPAGAKFCLGCGGPVGSAPAPRRSAPPSLSLPASFAGGRYHLQRFLGEGGKKRVYLAHDTKLDRDVAFALIKTEGLDADGLVRIRREAQAMGRLGDHPHIVTVYDTGDEAGTPYIVSQYMPGGSVEELLQRGDQHRVALDQTLRIAGEVCRALQHAHARGIIHRDLKPGNVWLSEDGTASLGDFGLAVALDRSRLTMAGMMVGTVAYMAPEQALGRPPDTRSDLYALGAMLYEMVTGRPPFLGDDAVAIISQHINTAPVAPTWHNPEVPRGLEALILKLLAKAPEERPESTAAVVEELRRIRERTSVEAPAARPLPETTDLRGLEWGLFVGRRVEMDQLKSALENALSGNGSLTMLVGEPGIGKTRLAEEFGVYASLRGAQVLTGRCYEGEVSLPYRPFVEALRQYVRARPDPALREEMGAGAPEIATLVSEIRQRFPDIQHAPALEPEAERLRLFDSVTQFVHNAAAANPVVLFLDDLHWADKPSLLLLRYLSRATSGTRVLLIGAYRDIELDRTHPLAEVLATLRREQPYKRILLRGLPQDDVLALLNTVDPSEEGTATRQAFAAALFQETEGNPFFVREVLTHLVEEGKLYREGGRWRARVTSVSQLGIPEGVREVIGRRLSRLSAGCSRMLTLASTMTGGFTWEALKAVSDGDEATLLDRLDEALRAQLIHERKREGEQAGRYDFTHALIRQTLYEELSTPRRVLLHRQIGETLETLYAANVEPHVAELAHHFYQAAPGGDVEKAIDYARRAGDRAVALCAWEEAGSHYERALHAVDLMPRPDDARRCELLLALAWAKRSAGENQGALDTYQQAAAIARRLAAAEPFARAAIGYENARFFLNGLDASLASLAVALLEEALDLLGAGDSALRAQSLARLARAQYLLTSHEQRATLSREAIKMARRVGDRPTLAFVLAVTLDAQWGPGDAEARRANVHEVLRLAEQTGDRNTAHRGHLALLVVHTELGDMRAVDREIAALAQLVEELRAPFFAHLNARAMRLLMQGRLGEAEAAMQQALAAGQRSQSEVPMLNFSVQLVYLRYLQGCLQEVEPVVAALVEQYPHLPGNRCGLAFVYSETAREAEARREFEHLAANDFADIPLNYTWQISMALLTEVCWFLGDARRAARLYELLLPYAGLNMTFLQNLCTGSASRQLGLMAPVLSRWDDAERHFTKALEMDARIGARPFVAHDQFYFADMLLRRDAPGDRQRALGLMNEALNTAQALGMQRLIERALALKVKAQGISSADLKDSIEAVVSVVQRERPDLRRHTAPDGTVTILFSDIEGSAQIAERLGDQRWLQLLRAHNAIVREHVAAHGGFEVKSQGDGFMLAFQSARRALLCAIAMQRAFAAYNQQPAREPLHVRIGLHAGEAIKEADDFFGKNVILASRIAAEARGGEVLVSSLVKELTHSSGDVQFGEVRSTELKGLSGTYVLHMVRWS